MKTRIVRIGRSQGVRIPKALLEQTGLRGEVEISIEGNALIIRAAESANASGEATCAADKRRVPPLPPYEKLRRLAKKYPPPASWFEEEEKSRAGWDAAFKEMVECGDAEIPDEDGWAV